MHATHEIALNEVDLDIFEKFEVTPRQTGIEGGHPMESKVTGPS